MKCNRNRMKRDYTLRKIYLDLVKRDKKTGFYSAQQKKSVMASAFSISHEAASLSAPSSYSLGVSEIETERAAQRLRL